jgi:hypothetical protein
MSQINDALKRASNADRERPHQVETCATMEPVVDRRGPFFAFLLGIGFVLALGLAGWFFWQGWNANHSPAPVKIEPVATVAPKSALVPVVRVAPPPVATPPLPQVTAPPAPALPAKPVEPAWPADLKVMGIFFRETNSRALISGKTVGVGDEINGIRVTGIENDRVTVEWNGRVKKLTMK